MGKFQAIEQFMATVGAKIPLGGFVINMVLVAFLAVVLNYVYVRFGSALSNRRMFGRNFLLISMTTMLIITVVKASLALSLGLVGALSIVRFRTAVKEPEELAYMFLAISLGLGFGANQQVVTITAFLIIIAAVILKHVLSGKEEDQNINLTVYSRQPYKVKLEQLAESLKKHCLFVNLKRFDENSESFEAHFLIKIKNFCKLSEVKNELRALDDSIKISFLDSLEIF